MPCEQRATKARLKCLGWEAAPQRLQLFGAMIFRRVVLCDGGFVAKEENFLTATAPELSCGKPGRHGSLFERATICSAVSSVAFVLYLLVRDSCACNCVVLGLNGS